MIKINNTVFTKSQIETLKSMVKLDCTDVLIVEVITSFKQITHSRAECILQVLKNSVTHDREIEDVFKNFDNCKDLKRYYTDAFLFDNSDFERQ